eukprot:scaffold2131_cov384-Prasinococcus_capsulatus_cf.AAC.15
MDVFITDKGSEPRSVRRDLLDVALFILCNWGALAAGVGGVRRVTRAQKDKVIHGHITSPFLVDVRFYGRVLDEGNVSCVLHEASKCALVVGIVIRALATVARTNIAQILVWLRSSVSVGARALIPCRSSRRTSV